MFFANIFTVVLFKCFLREGIIPILIICLKHTPGLDIIVLRNFFVFFFVVLIQPF